MDERVKTFLETKQKEIETKKEKKKAKRLISLGLYEKIYSPDGNYTEEYNSSEWDEKAQKARYYKIVPFDVSDKEFEEIETVCKSANEQPEKQTNPIATLLTVIAWIIYIGGFIAGIVLGSVAVNGVDSEFSFSVAFIFWFITLISGTMMLFLAEYIKILNDIKNKK